MKVGIFGRDGSGKSTLFRALASGGEAPSRGQSAGLCTIRVPDDRVDRLAGVFHPRKVTHITITFEDIDTKEGELLPPDTLANIKGSDVLAVVVRGFSDDFHPAPPAGLDPVREFRAIDSELALSDYLIAQKRIERMAKEARRDIEWTTLHKAIAVLEKEVPLRQVAFSAEEKRVLSGFRLASMLPVILVLNVGENELSVEAYPELDGVAGERGIPLLRLSAKIEEEIAQLSPAEQADFLKEMGIAESARDRLVRGAFEAMNYISFLTVGEDEVRAWNIPKGSTALMAAGRIHSDLEKGFIRAEVIASEDFLRCGSMAKAKAEGKWRLEGKEYILRDGEIFHVRFNV
ncbi:MAG: redox-regulated ATPase YchF [Deltaproteobacteria bacterium]|nr:redox-regulated ATPase YchF [Deltaproteobacteria bacterium]